VVTPKHLRNVSSLTWNFQERGERGDILEKKTFRGGGMDIF